MLMTLPSNILCPFLTLVIVDMAISVRGTRGPLLLARLNHIPSTQRWPKRCRFHPTSVRAYGELLMIFGRP